jgi:hypothetical protein
LVIPKENQKFACFLNESFEKIDCNPKEKAIFSVHLKEQKFLYYIS